MSANTDGDLTQMVNCAKDPDDIDAATSLVPKMPSSGAPTKKGGRTDDPYEEEDIY